MALSSTDDFLILQLGIRRSTLAKQITELQHMPDLLPILQNELAETEAKLVAIDPTILTLAQEAEKANTAAVTADIKVGETK